MRTEPWRSDPANYTPPGEAAGEPLQIWPRYSDLDAMRHLNNVALLGMHLEARIRWQRAHLGEDTLFSDDVLLRPRELRTDFLQQSHYPGPLQLAVRLTGITADGWRLSTGMFQDGRLVGLHEADMTAWQDGRPVPLPASIVEALQTCRAGLDDPRLGHHDIALPLLADDALHLSAYPVQSPVGARLTDQDADNVIGELALGRYAEQGRALLLERLDRREIGMMAASIRMRCLRHTHGPAEWRVGLGISRMGNSSIGMRVALFDNGQCQAVFDDTMVLVDPATGRPMRMPDSLRQTLKELATSDCIV